MLPDKLVMLNSVLPIHNQLFESHRIKHIRDILEGLLVTELSYHIRAIEELSPMLELIRSST